MQKTLVSEKLSNGTAYHEETCQEVINILEDARQNRSRIRIFFGDTITGEDWKEENYIMGYIGRSTGSIKIPLLVNNSSSHGGGALLDHCIVKITVDKYTVYQHENYYLGECSILESGIKEYPFSVFIDLKCQANFETKEKAENYIKFLKGERNRI
jgi:hypothetical protein